MNDLTVMIIAVVSSGALSTLIVGFLSRKRTQADATDVITHASEVALNMVAGQLDRAEKTIIKLQGDLDKALLKLEIARSELHDAMVRIRVLERELRKYTNGNDKR